MTWQLIGTVAPLINVADWQSIITPINFSLLRFTYVYTGSFVESDFPKAFVRFRIGNSFVNAGDINHGVSEYWNTIFPNDDDSVLWDATQFIIPLQPNYVEIRRSTKSRSTAAEWSITVEQFNNPNYQITYLNV